MVLCRLYRRRASSRASVNICGIFSTKNYYKYISGQLHIVIGNVVEKEERRRRWRDSMSNV